MHIAVGGGELTYTPTMESVKNGKYQVPSHIRTTVVLSSYVYIPPSLLFCTSLLECAVLMYFSRRSVAHIIVVASAVSTPLHPFGPVETHVLP